MSDSLSNMSSVSKISRRGVRRKKAKVVQQDFGAIKDAYKRNAEAFEGMTFDEDEIGWGKVAQEFVFDVKSERFRKFIKDVHNEKVQVEKKMKFELEDRIFKMRE